MQTDMELKIAKMFYEENYTKEDLIHFFHLRPKVVQMIIGKYKDRFVKAQ